MERLTRATVKVDETAAKYMAAPGSIPADLRIMNDRLLDLVINGPTLNGVNKDVLRQLIRQLYAELKPYEDTGLLPEEVERCKLTLMGKSLAEITEFDGVSIKRLKKLATAEKAGRLEVLPCKIGGTVWTNIAVQGDRYRKSDRPYPVKVVYIGMGNLGSFFHVVYRNGRNFPFNFDEIGKTVFLTRKEAERALEGGQKEEHVPQ